MRKRKYRKRKSNNSITIAIFVTLLLISCTTIIYTLILSKSCTIREGSPKRSDNSATRVFSHRGASKEEIEHTTAAYNLAILYGSKYIEQDLVTSKDQTLYVSHDLSAKRITGVDKLFSKMTDAQISNLRTADDQKILTLQDIFNLYGHSVNYVIELKDNSSQTKLFENIVRKNKLEDNIIVQATDIKPLDDLNKSFKNMKKLLLVSNQKQLNDAITFGSVNIISAQKKLMTKENVELVHNHKKLFNIWTLDSTNEIKKAINLNVDSYFTDFTAKALAIEKKYRK